MFRKSEAVRICPVYRLHPINRTRQEEVIVPDDRPKTRTPRAGLKERVDWLMRTTYRPTHNGTASPRLAHLRNVHDSEVSRRLAKEGRTHWVYVSADSKAAFDAIEEDRQRKRKYKREEQIRIGV
ncbi:hypothetical protein K2X30_15110 [bacterium]|jgi:hypothetical protein|nr:hypothetical protein [bacterium]